jgi:hypothetical protein
VTRPGLRLRIGRDGQVHAETIGFVGEACLDVVPLVEQLVAAQVVASHYLPEFFEQQGTEDATREDATEAEPVRYVTEEDRS